LWGASDLALEDLAEKTRNATHYSTNRAAGSEPAKGAHAGTGESPANATRTGLTALGGLCGAAAVLICSLGRADIGIVLHNAADKSRLHVGVLGIRI
jgi:hypothetical protein